MPRRIVLIAAVWLAGSLGGWATTQAVVNGDFETGSISPWTTDACSGAACSDWHVLSGGHSGSFGVESTGADDIMQTFPAYDGVNPGVYTGLVSNDVHLWFSTTANFFAVELLYSGVTPVLCDPTTGVLCIDVTDHGWVDYGSELYSNIQSAGSGRFLTGIVIGSGGGNSDVSYLDDVSISANTSFNPVPEPGSMLLIGSGLVALAGRRYRANSPR